MASTFVYYWLPEVPERSFELYHQLKGDMFTQWGYFITNKWFVNIYILIFDGNPLTGLKAGIFSQWGNFIPNKFLFEIYICNLRIDLDLNIAVKL